MFTGISEWSSPRCNVLATGRCEEWFPELTQPIQLAGFLGIANVTQQNGKERERSWRRRWNQRFWITWQVLANLVGLFYGTYSLRLYSPSTASLDNILYKIYTNGKFHYRSTQIGKWNLISFCRWFRFQLLQCLVPARTNNSTTRCPFYEHWTVLFMEIIFS